MSWKKQQNVDITKTMFQIGTQNWAFDYHPQKTMRDYPSPEQRNASTRKNKNNDALFTAPGVYSSGKIT